MNRCASSFLEVIGIRESLVVRMKILQTLHTELMCHHLVHRQILTSYTLLLQCLELRVGYLLASWQTHAISNVRRFCGIIRWVLGSFLCSWWCGAIPMTTQLCCHHLVHFVEVIIKVDFLMWKSVKFSLLVLLCMLLSLSNMISCCCLCVLAGSVSSHGMIDYLKNITSKLQRRTRTQRMFIW